jgi:hypothetical protein
LENVTASATADPLRETTKKAKGHCEGVLVEKIRICGWEKPMSQKRNMGPPDCATMSERRQQIPCGDDNQKGKCKSDCEAVGLLVAEGFHGFYS